MYGDLDYFVHDHGGQDDLLGQDVVDGVHVRLALGQVETHLRTGHAQTVQGLDHVDARGRMAQEDKPVLGEREIGGVEQLARHKLADAMLLRLRSARHAERHVGERGQNGHAQVQHVLLALLGGRAVAARQLDQLVQLLLVGQHALEVGVEQAALGLRRANQREQVVRIVRRLFEDLAQRDKTLANNKQKVQQMKKKASKSSDDD